MLIKFEVTGFKNFENKIELDFSKARDYKFNSSCVANDVLQKIIIYGKNSVGKSNLGLALFDIVPNLTSNNVTPGLYDEYLNVNNKEGFAEFHYIFSFGSNKIYYTYHKNEKRDIILENITVNGKILYHFDYEVESGDLANLREQFPTLNLDFRAGDSILKYVIANSKLEDDHPLYQMHKYVSEMLWFRNLEENRYIGYTTRTNDYYDFISKEGMLEEFEDLLRRADIKGGLSIKTDLDGKQTLYFMGPTLLPFFRTASSGTKALYTFFYWYKTATNASLVFIDEFDAFYHYELSEIIVEMMKEKSGCQSIFTTHNTNLFSNGIMRPDCYFILTYDKLTPIVDATRRELREGHNLEKLYMSGEFDAC